jgi:hypothetical protein
MTVDNGREERIFGVDGASFLRPILTLVKELEEHPVCYTYMEQTEFLSLCRKDWKASSKVYWEELLGRAHLAAAVSIIRAYRWCSGMVVTHRESLFLPFCANFRSLIEAVGDGYDALRNVAATLATSRGPANAALLRRAEHPSISDELEHQLIHFSHGRKLKKGEAAPDSHVAKPATEYIRGLEKVDVPRVYECYSVLCEYTHPAARSVAQLCVPNGDGTYTLVPGHDEVRLKGLITSYEQLFPPLLMAAFNPGLLVLKVLLHLEAPRFHCRAMQAINLSNVGGWKKYAKQMGVRP